MKFPTLSELNLEGVVDPVDRVESIKPSASSVVPTKLLVSSVVFFRSVDEMMFRHRAQNYSLQK